MGKLSRILLRHSRPMGLSLTLGLVGLSGCLDDPQDPKTWIKKLDDVREQKEALRQLTKLKDESSVGPLSTLFKRSKDPEHLRVITKIRSDSAMDLFIAQLDYSDDNYENASVAATCIAFATPMTALVEPLLTRQKFQPRDLLLGVASLPGIWLVVGGVPAAC